MKPIHFIGGMPRAGSTLLCNLLAQNPRFHATAASGCLDVLFGVRNQWDRLQEHQANPDHADNERRKRDVLGGILENYHGRQEKPVVFDKSRGWIAYIELLEFILERRVKVLVPVRNVADVLASFEKLHRKAAAKGRPPGESEENYMSFQCVEGRCEWWMRDSQPVGLALNRIRDAIRRGLRDRLHFVEFRNLTEHPLVTMQEIYAFLGEPLFAHDFDHVEQVTREDDFIYGYDDLHTIRSKVEPVPSNWRETLGPCGSRWQAIRYW